jgi:hypothetical protein
MALVSKMLFHILIQTLEVLLHFEVFLLLNGLLQTFHLNLDILLLFNEPPDILGDTLVIGNILRFTLAPYFKVLMASFSFLFGVISLFIVYMHWINNTHVKMVLDLRL